MPYMLEKGNMIVSTKCPTCGITKEYTYPDMFPSDRDVHYNIPCLKCQNDLYPYRNSVTAPVIAYITGYPEIGVRKCVGGWHRNDVYQVAKLIACFHKAWKRSRIFDLIKLVGWNFTDWHKAISAEGVDIIR